MDSRFLKGLLATFIAVGFFGAFDPLLRAEEQEKPADHKSAFSFVALGDTAYNVPRDYPQYEALIRKINESKLAFTIHVGDIWGSDGGDKAQKKILDFFAQYDHPVIYTPGDNEWTDTWRNGLEPIEQLALIRRNFFPRPESLGQRKISLLRQGDRSKEHAEFVENARWTHEGILFATIHVVGSGNNAQRPEPKMFEEYVKRNKANVAWIKETFKEAREMKARAVVLAFQAEMFGKPKVGKERDYAPSFWDTLDTISEWAERFGRPVLLVHGDGHQFIVDRPLLQPRGEEKPARFANITRLQVYGAPDVRAVKVTVEPDTPWIFSYSPLYPEEKPVQETQPQSRKAYLGVALQGEIPAEDREAYGLKKEETGWIIGAVVENGPADKCGLMDTDVIVTFDGAAIGTPQDFARQIGSHKPGAEIRLGIVREKKPMELTIVLGVR